MRLRAQCNCWMAD